jgi:hypothetical protein
MNATQMYIIAASPFVGIAFGWLHATFTIVKKTQADVKLLNEKLDAINEWMALNEHRNSNTRQGN